MFITIYFILFADGEDFVSMPASLTFDSSRLRVCFNVTILDDDRFEFDEDFVVNITTTESQVTLDPISTVVMINDDDGKFVMVDIFMNTDVLYIQINVTITNYRILFLRNHHRLGTACLSWKGI